jgi:hypothetical protein
MKLTSSMITCVAVAAVTLTACGALGKGSPTPGITATVDYCAPDNIKIAAGLVNEFMRQFDDESALASNLPRSQLATHISTLQAIRRAAQDQRVPTCLAQLKQLQLTHMNTVISTLLGFLGGGDQASVSQGIDVARQQHDQYVLELAKVLGVTPIVVTRAPTPEPTEVLGGTPGAPAVMALNPGPFPINLRGTPSESGELVATLDVGKAVLALAESSDGKWVQVVVPGHPDETAWVLSSEVQLSSPTPS